MLTTSREALLRCPDDGARVRPGPTSMTCEACERAFPRHATDLVEMLPSRALRVSASPGDIALAWESYLRLVEEPFDWSRTNGAWGDLDHAPAGYAAFVRAERAAVLRLLDPRPGAVAVDVSGGVGNYSLFLAPRVGTLVHCEAHVPSLLRAHAARIGNALFVRAAYPRLPLADAAFDHVICTDTLIRGPGHDTALLAEILRVLRPGGTAAVDFHASRRLHFRNDLIRTYDSAELRDLLPRAGARILSTHGFGHAPARLVPTEALYPIVNGLLAFAPHQRWIVLFERPR